METQPSCHTLSMCSLVIHQNFCRWLGFITGKSEGSLIQEEEGVTFISLLFIFFCLFIVARQLLQNPVLVPALQYLTIKGYQVGVLGSTWVLKYDLPKASWFAPRSIDSSCVQTLNQALNNDVAGLSVLQPGVCIGR